MSKVEVIIVLGQALNSDGSEPVTLTQRINKAAELFVSANPRPIIVCGGDPAHTGRTEASLMKISLVQRGIPSDAIILEDQSATTLENALNSWDILRACKATAAVVVTSDFHSPRAHLCFESVFAYRGGSTVTLSMHPSPSGLPIDIPSNDAAMINEQSLGQRIAGEENFLRSLARLFDIHMPAGVNVPVPSESKIQRALTALTELRAEAEAAARAPPPPQLPALGVHAARRAEASTHLLRRLSVDACIVGARFRLDMSTVERLRGKAVLFIRHAESVDGALGKALTLAEKMAPNGGAAGNPRGPWQRLRWRKELTDAQLTPHGCQQAGALGGLLCRERRGAASLMSEVQLVVCSPLTRAKQTAALTFGLRADRSIQVSSLLRERVDAFSDLLSEEFDFESPPPPPQSSTPPQSPPSASATSACLLDQRLDLEFADNYAQAELAVALAALASREDKVELRGVTFCQTPSHHTVAPNILSRKGEDGRAYPQETEESFEARLAAVWQWLGDPSRQGDRTVVLVTHSKLLLQVRDRGAVRKGLLDWVPQDWGEFNASEARLVEFY